MPKRPGVDTFQDHLKCFETPCQTFWHPSIAGGEGVPPLPPK